jgi:phage-related protein
MEVASVAEKEVGASAKVASAGIGLSLGSIIKTLGPLALMFGLYAGGKAVIKEVVDETDAMHQSNVNLIQTIKSTGDSCGLTAKQVQDLSKKLADHSVFSRSAVQDGEAMLATFTHIGKDVFPMASQALVDLSQKMGKDPKNAAIQLGKALNDPVNGLTALKRVGVTFSDAQKEVIKNLVKTGDVAGAQRVIIAELNKEFGGQAAAAVTTYQGRVALLKKQFDDFASGIVNGAEKALTNLGKTLVNGVIYLERHKLALDVLKIVMGIIGAIILMQTGFWAAHTVVVLLATIAQWAHVVAANAVTIAMGLAAAAQWLFAASTWAVLGPILLIIAAVALLAFGVYELIKNWSTVKEFFAKLWDDTKEIFSKAWSGIVSVVMAIVTPFINGAIALFNGMKDGLDKIMQGLREVFSGIWDVIKNIFLGAILLILDLVTGNFGKLKTDAEGIFHNLSAAFGQIWDGIKQIFTGTVMAIVGFLTTAWEGIKNTAIAAWNGIKDTAISAFNGLKSGIASVLSTLGGVVSNGFNGAISFIKSLPGQALQWGKDFINGLINGIKSMVAGVIKTVTDLAKSIADAVRGTLGIKSPSKVMAEIGGYTVQGLAKGIIDSKGLVTDAISGLGSDMSIGLKLSPAVGGGGSAGNKASGGSESTGKVMNMTVNNYSPTALTPSEIARQVRMAWQQAALQY